MLLPILGGVVGVGLLIAFCVYQSRKQTIAAQDKAPETSSASKTHVTVHVSDPQPVVGASQVSTASAVGCSWRVISSGLVARKDISLDSDPVRGMQVALGDIVEQNSSAITIKGNKGDDVVRIQIKDRQGNVGWTTLHSKFLEKAPAATPVDGDDVPM